MATATTATANVGTGACAGHTGRFAPSPSGALHLGSLTTAMASYLEARAHAGRWLLRIDDLDTTRVVPGVAAGMLLTLEALGFEWHGPVLYQSQRTARYAAAAAALSAAGRSYPCACTRRQLAEFEPGVGYPGTCRAAPQGPPPHAQRFRMDESQSADFDDRLLGRCHHAVSTLGDPIICRRDGLHAYQLAVVVDDADSGVTAVVRGRDLAASTPWQLQLQQALGYAQPEYTHLPLVTDAGGAKLAKSAHAVRIDLQARGSWLHRALQLLRQSPPAELAVAAPAEIWTWATRHWNLQALAGVSELPL
jgi:glutamyl-Q tRNA(Asp) synthetase